MKLADKPGSVVDSHSSRRIVANTLEQPTRWQREPRLITYVKCQPIWSCCGWRLPRFTVTKYARLCGPIPRLIPCGFQRTAVSRHPALCSPDFPPPAYASGDCLASFISILACQRQSFFITRRYSSTQFSSLLTHPLAKAPVHHQEKASYQALARFLSPR